MVQAATPITRPGAIILAISFIQTRSSITIGTRPIALRIPIISALAYTIALGIGLLSTSR